MFNFVYLTIPALASMYFLSYAAKNKREYYNILLFILSLGFLLVFGFRGDVLPDHANYKFIFENWSPVGYEKDALLNSVDVGYGYMNYLLRTAGMSFGTYLAAITYFNFYAKTRLFNAGVGGNAAIAIFLCLVFPFYELVTIRQALAVCFAMLFVNNLHESKSRALIFLLVAIAMHGASIVFAALMFAKIIPDVLKKPIVLLVLALLMAVTGVVPKLFDVLSGYGVVPSRLDYYYNDSAEFSEGSSVSSLQSIIKTVVMSVYFIFVGYYADRLKGLLNLSESKAFDSYFFLYGLSVFLRVGFADFAILSGRGSAVLLVAECIVSSKIFFHSGFNVRLLISAYYIIQCLMTLYLSGMYGRFEFWFV